jgi:hypothetical protein
MKDLMMSAKVIVRNEIIDAYYEYDGNPFHMVDDIAHSTGYSAKMVNDVLKTMKDEDIVDLDNIETGYDDDALMYVADAVDNSSECYY